LIGEAAVGVLALALAAYWLVAGRNAGRRELASWRGRRRVERAQGAALEAAEQDPAFEPTHVRTAVRRMLRAAEREWRTPGAMPPRPDQQVIQRWAREKRAWLGRGLRVEGEPRIDLVHLVNREDDAEDRVVVRVRMQLHHERVAAPLDPHTVHVDELWTLGRFRASWRLLSTDGDPRTGPALGASLIPTPWADEARLSEESLRELSQSAGVAQPPPGELVAARPSVSATLADLALVDGRFAPELLGLEIGRIFEAWGDATTGPGRPLHLVASDAAADALLHPRGQASRLVLADARLTTWRVDALSADATPPRVGVSVTASAIRYLVDTESGEHLTGSTTVPHTIELDWTLELADDAHTTWRLASTTDPARELPDG
jgi:hypothetical protein